MTVTGEWVLRASVMQCEDAFVGRVHFMDRGELVYLTTAGDLIGRGFGRWVLEGQVLGFQLDIFQYEANSMKHVQLEPHRLRGLAKLPPEKGVWCGEWHFLAFQQPPRLIGHFHAQRSLPSLPLPSLNKKPEELPESAKKATVQKLDKLCECFPMMQPSWVPHHLAGKIQDVHYVRNFLTPIQVEEFERIIDQTCDWERMATRDTQEFGSSNRCDCGRSLMRVALPRWMSEMADALSVLGVFHPVLFPANSVRINAYKPGQGIYPHMDGPVYFPRAAILSLGSQCVFDFYPRLDDEDEGKRAFTWDRDKEVPSAPELPPGTEPALSLLLEPGSLLVFSGDAFVHHRHGIKAVEEDEIGPQVKNAKDIGLSVGDSLRRSRRVSLTIRHLLPRCNCSALL
eukprot:TRINITY_DN97640_c0_g1_i1.p1 TRINITY_DN97640_c0_g1~~TRINITY_DN97640_c0_g1_i1.p1  ORF type:complete len:398 (+),score=51.96 TRINITY_DN97640_c0_g1_i1:51-1244(+)